MNASILKEYMDTIECLKSGKGLKMPEIISMVGYSYSTHVSVIKNKRCADSVKNRVMIQNFIKVHADEVTIYKSLDDMIDIPSSAAVQSLAESATGHGNGKATQVDIDTMVKKANVYLETDCDFWTMLQRLIAKKPHNIEIEIRVK